MKSTNRNYFSIKVLFIYIYIFHFNYYYLYIFIQRHKQTRENIRNGEINLNKRYSTVKTLRSSYVPFDLISIHLLSYLFDLFESSLLVLGLSLCINRVNGKIAEFKNIKANCTSMESFQNAKYKMNYMCIHVWKIHIHTYIQYIYIYY